MLPSQLALQQQFKPGHLGHLPTIHNPLSFVLCELSFDLHLQPRPKSATSATCSHLPREAATSATSQLLPTLTNPARHQPPPPPPTTRACHRRHLATCSATNRQLRHPSREPA